MSKTLPPLPALPPAEVQEWSESWITLRGEGWKKETVEEYARTYALQAIAANTPAVPDGWTLVPVEPTQEMVDAYEGTNPEDFWVKLPNLADGTTRKTRDGDASIYYRAMLAAAPQPQPQPLSDQEIADAAPVNETLAHGFKLGVRWAEAAHGIKE